MIASTCCLVFQSTLPARGATVHRQAGQQQGNISIHAPRTGSDFQAVDASSNVGLISIHAPRTGSDAQGQGHPEHHAQFQSTLPARGATEAVLRLLGQRGFQSTLPARGATSYIDGMAYVRVFQSTLPARGATTPCVASSKVTAISIHAPRTGSDDQRTGAVKGHHDFNPRSPHGERPVRLLSAHSRRTYFNPRSPHGERPRFPIGTSPAMHFNPRSPHGERPAWSPTAAACGDFNPRSPHGERRGAVLQRNLPRLISIHAPRTGSDFQRGEVRPVTGQFQSTLPARGATRRDLTLDKAPEPFQSTLPARGATGRGNGRRRRRLTFQSTLPARGATGRS